jgi:hypothetical protein
MKSLKRYLTRYPMVSNNLSKVKTDKDYVVSTWEYEKKLSQVTRKKKEQERNKKRQAQNL